MLLMRMVVMVVIVMMRVMMMLMVMMMVNGDDGENYDHACLHNLMCMHMCTLCMYATYACITPCACTYAHCVLLLLLLCQP